jgi:hypothetical protein
VGGWQTTRIYQKGVAIANASFELPVVSIGGAANPAESSWTWSGSAGIARGHEARWGWFSAPAPSGSQVAFFQGTASATQNLAVAAGSYTLTFQAIGRNATAYNGFNPIVVQFNGTTVRTVAASELAGTAWRSFSVTIVANATGTFPLRFAGQGNGSLDVATSIDEVKLLRIGAGPLVAGSVKTDAGPASLLYPRGFPMLNGSPIAGQGSQLEYVRMSTPLTARAVSFALGAAPKQ